MNMAVTPVSFILRTFGALGLSYLISAREAASLISTKNYQLLVFVYSILGLLYALWVLLTLDILVPLIFGRNYTVATAANALIAVLVFFRIQRGGAPTIALLTAERTGELALLNLTSGLGLLCALGFVMLWPHIESVLAGVVIGDFTGLTIFFLASSTRARSRKAAATDFAISLVALFIMVGAFVWFPQTTWRARCVVAGAGLLGLGVHLIFSLLLSNAQQKLLSAFTDPAAH
jgi:O-antigen/teichoic acid export membrane protein